MADVFKGAGLEAAIVAADDPEMDVAAERVQAAIKAGAQRHRLTGDYEDSIKVTSSTYKGVRDRVIYSDDPGAYAIEKGFRPKRKDGTTGKHVPGKFIFTNVARKGV